jgi:hypothetical protein
VRILKGLRSPEGFDRLFMTYYIREVISCQGDSALLHASLREAWGTRPLDFLAGEAQQSFWVAVCVTPRLRFSPVCSSSYWEGFLLPDAPARLVIRTGAPKQPS